LGKFNSHRRIPHAISPKEYAERLGVSENKVLNWIRSGEIAAINVASKLSNRPRWRIPEEAIEAFEAARTSRPVVKPTPRRRDYPRYV
jgi:excisionase family DNA binding protein